MSKKKNNKSKRIKKELDRLNVYFGDVELDGLGISEGLIHRAAFMRITLEDYEDDINENGSVEMFRQSPDVEPYERARPVMQFYNTTNKNYQSIIKQLIDLLPKQDNKADVFRDIVDGLQKPR